MSRVQSSLVTPPHSSICDRSPIALRVVCQRCMLMLGAIARRIESMWGTRMSLALSALMGKSRSSRRQADDADSRPLPMTGEGVADQDALRSGGEDHPLAGGWNGPPGWVEYRCQTGPGSTTLSAGHFCAQRRASVPGRGKTGRP